MSPEWGRSGDDLNFLYTGGTTGMPKGVMWRQDDLAVKLTATLGTPLTETAPSTTFAARSPDPALDSCRPVRRCTAPATSPA